MAQQRPIRVLLVDDHEMVRSGLAVFLEGHEDMQLVGQAADGAEAVRLCGEVQPDVVLMDLVMPGMDGITATRIIREQHPGVHVIALTSFKEAETVQAALKVGASGYVLKNASVSELAAAIRAAHAGHPALSPEAAQVLLDMVRGGAPAALPAAELTERERQVLGLMTQGYTNRQIAQKLAISPSTVKTYASSIFSKLGVASRTEAVALALKSDLST